MFSFLNPISCRVVVVLETESLMHLSLFLPAILVQNLYKGAAFASHRLK